MDPIDTFWCEPTGKARITLRRYTMGDYADGRYDHQPDRNRRMCGAVEPHNGYTPGCTASAVVFEAAPERRGADGFLTVWPSDEFAGNPAWPDICERCGVPFTDNDSHRAVNQNAWYIAPGRGQWTIADLPAGAMYDAHWYHDRNGPTAWVGDDGISLMVVCPPGGALHAHWCVDGPATNCDRKGEAHRCWCRSGRPRAANVNVTKDGCDTCTAGAGSIATADWHGYLRDGRLVTA